MQECNYLWILHPILLSQLKPYYLALIIPYIVKNFSDYNCYLRNIGNPVIIRAASSWSWSNLSAFLGQHSSHSSHIYPINPINPKFNSENLNQVDNHKHLGVTISRNCKWAKHINNICGNPVIIRAASSWSWSNLSAFLGQHSSHSSHAYASNGKI
jgi:hypothetical protein